MFECGECWGLKEVEIREPENSFAPTRGENPFSSRRSVGHRACRPPPPRTGANGAFDGLERDPALA
jgi:hypothetical protein